MKKLTEWQRIVLDEVRAANVAGQGFIPANHLNGQRRRRYYQTLRALEGRCPALVEHHQQGGKELGYWIPASMTPEDVAGGVATMLTIAQRSFGFGVVSAVQRENLVALELNTGQVFTMMFREETCDLQEGEGITMNETELRSFVMCGLCEDYKYEVPVAEDGWGDWSITVDGLMQLREQGWEYDGISWRCPDCVEMEEDDDAAN